MPFSWIEVALEEYKTLRQEILQSMQAQQAIVNYGLAVVGVLLGVAFNSWQQTVPATVLLLAFVPIVCYLVLFVWLGEIARMMRAGQYLKQLEEKISSKFPNESPPLAWENYLREPVARAGTPQMVWNYIAVVGLFLLAAIVAVVVGNIRIFNEVERSTLIWLNTVESTFFIACVVYIFVTGSRFR